MLFWMKRLATAVLREVGVSRSLATPKNMLPVITLSLLRPRSSR
jgi:hypothetical protein